MANNLPERVGILESNVKMFSEDLQSTRAEVHSVRSLVEEKTDALMQAIETKTSPNKSFQMQLAGLIIGIVIAGAGLNYFIINARVSKTDSALDSAMYVANLREDWRKERETLILGITKAEADAVHNDILGQIKGVRAHVNKMQDTLDEQEKR